MQLKDLLPAGIAIVVAGIAISVGADLTTTLQNQHNATSDAYAERVAHGVALNASMGLSEIGSWFGTIGLIVAAAVVIGILVTAFYFKNR